MSGDGSEEEEDTSTADDNMIDDAEEALVNDPALRDGRNTPGKVEDDNVFLFTDMVKECAAAAEPEPPEPMEDDVRNEFTFAEKRSHLNDFFKERVKAGKWPKTTLPRKGKDIEFDEFLPTIGLFDQSGRGHAAQRWRAFKTENGFDGPITSADVKHNEGSIAQAIAACQRQSGRTILSEFFARKIATW